MSGEASISATAAFTAWSAHTRAGLMVGDQESSLAWCGEKLERRPGSTIELIPGRARGFHHPLQSRGRSKDRCRGRTGIALDFPAGAEREGTHGECTAGYLSSLGAVQSRDSRVDSSHAKSPQAESAIHLSYWFIYQI